MWTALFGMAVMAVDFGYLYTKKRGIQSVADSALKAAMPVYRTQGRQRCASARDAIARLERLRAGVGSTTIQFAEPAIGTQFKVTIGRTHPTFFGGIFGMGPRSIKASATGKVLTTGGPLAIHADDTTACAAQWAWGTGIEVTGGGSSPSTATSRARTRSTSEIRAHSCNGTNCRMTGTVTRSPCHVLE